MAAALVSDRSVDAEVAAPRLTLTALVHPTLQLVTEVTTVILAITDQLEVHTDLVLTWELVCSTQT
jgi:hypothetical protein